MYALLVLAIAAVVIAATIVCVKKGKGTTALVGFLFFWPAIVVGAIRLAKPGSPIFNRYDEQKRMTALRRFPKEAAGIVLLEQAQPSLQLTAATREP